MAFSNSILIESRSARDEGLACIASQETQISTLSKAKHVVFSLWRKTGYLTIPQVAEYYEVPENTIRQNYTRCKTEFDSDGVLRVEGDTLKEVRDTMSLSPFSPRAVLFPARAVVRMGFILKDSVVAAQLRTVTLNVLQGVGQVVDRKILDALAVGFPALSPFRVGADLKISAPLAPHFDMIERKLRGSFPDGAIPGLKKKDIREKLAALSTYTQDFKFGTQTEMRFPLGSKTCAKYPDLMSPVFEFEVEGQKKSAVFALQISEFLVEHGDVEDAIGRQYVKTCREHYKTDYAFVFLVSPFGATPLAESCIKDRLPHEMRGFFGVMTVKEVASFLVQQARDERKSNLVKGEVKKNFKEVLDYRIPTAPLEFLLGL
jgi:hypothetical protein